ncbi:putative amidase domain protein [Lysobacter capsici]|nr:putative amidase domain protein [Lysobacter capsici]
MARISVTAKPITATTFARTVTALLIAALAAACSQPASPPAERTTVRVWPAPSAEPAAASPPLVAAARAQVGVVRRYDPAYVQLAYPGGDVAADRGVCTDVVIRALRVQGLDLQQTVHEDMRANFAAYPTIWRAKSTDRNIDHRRVPNLRRWFERQRWALPVSERAADYRAGDLVTWELNGGLPHIGIVSDRKSWDRQRPLILHNIARGTQEDDVLFDYPITGHYRPVLPGAAVVSR